MAAIEKIDEMTGEYPYPGWKMWDYKRNHIQVCPWNRKAFKCAKHVLVIAKSEKQIMWKGGGTSTLEGYGDYVEYCLDRSKVYLDLWRGPGYYTWSGQQYSPNEFLKKIRVEQEYLFDLYCPDLPGEVDGHYMNYSTDLSAVKRRLKRMIGSDLKIVYVDASSKDLRKYAEELYNEQKN